MDRRGFLTAGRSVALASGIAVAADLIGCSGPSQPQAQRHGPRGSQAPVEVSGHLSSRYTGASMGWTISTPGHGQRPRAIVYCLHAKGGGHRMAFDSIRVPQVAASLGIPIAVAAVDGGRDSYWHRRADGSDALAMLLKEFVPLVRARVGHLPQALMGWSMGGYGALLAAERASRQFQAVSVASPALWLTPGATAPGAFDSPANFYANDVFTGVDALRTMAVAVFCGTGDPFYPATRHLVSLMDFPHLARFGPGMHDPRYWRRVAPAQLRAIARVRGITRSP
jgi:pimeloyl-ACP methyl ester carboxylesterase